MFIQSQNNTYILRLKYKITISVCFYSTSSRYTFMFINNLLELLKSCLLLCVITLFSF